jgi:predicted nucleotidyltransferase
MEHDSDDILNEIVNRLVAGLQPETVILFGSHATGTATEHSDIDMLVVVKDSIEPRYRRSRKAYRCLRGITIPTDVLVLTRQEMAEAATVPSSLVARVLQEGKVVYG